MREGGREGGRRVRSTSHHGSHKRGAHSGRGTSSASHTAERLAAGADVSGMTYPLKQLYLIHGRLSIVVG